MAFDFSLRPLICYIHDIWQTCDHTRPDEEEQFPPGLCDAPPLTAARKRRPEKVDTFPKKCRGMVGMLGLKPGLLVHDVEKTILAWAAGCTLDQEVSGMEDE